MKQTSKFLPGMTVFQNKKIIKAKKKKIRKKSGEKFRYRQKKFWHQNGYRNMILVLVADTETSFGSTLLQRWSLVFATKIAATGKCTLLPSKECCKDPINRDESDKTPSFVLNYFEKESRKWPLAFEIALVYVQH